MAFMNPWTEEQIGFLRVKERMRAPTPYGVRYQRERTPFLRGQEEQWQSDREDLTQFSDVFSQACGDQSTFGRMVRAALAALPDIQTVAQLLQKREALRTEQCANLKRFAAIGLRIDRLLADVSARRPWWNAAVLVQVHARLSGENRMTTADCSDEETIRRSFNDSFSLHDVADDAVKDLYAALQGVRIRRSSAENGFTRALCAEHRVPVRRDHTLIVSVDDPLAAQRASSDPRLQFLQRTAFEVVLEPVWPEEVRQLRGDEDVLTEKLAIGEERTLQMVSAMLYPYADALAVCAQAIGRLDDVCARVSVACDEGWVWSQLSSGGAAVLAGVYQPSRRQGWTPCTVTLDRAVSVLTGPNMGGKTATLKTVLLALACHQYGYPVPADSVSAPLFTALRYVGGDAQSLLSGLSSFGAEVVALQEAISLDGAFLCLDEVGRNTSPAEGAALVTGLLETLLDTRRQMTVCATHFTIALPDQMVGYFRMQGVKRGFLAARHGPASASEGIARLSEVMDFTIVPAQDGASPSEGLAVAQWLGLGEDVIERARRRLDRQQEGTLALPGSCTVPRRVRRGRARTTAQHTIPAEQAHFRDKGGE